MDSETTFTRYINVTYNMINEENGKLYFLIFY